MGGGGGGKYKSRGGNERGWGRWGWVETGKQPKESNKLRWAIGELCFSEAVAVRPCDSSLRRSSKQSLRSLGPRSRESKPHLITEIKIPGKWNDRVLIVRNNR